MDLSRLDLPLVPHLPRIGELLAARRLLVLQAEPGAGKSTLVPPYLLDAPWLAGRKIVLLEPRRLAAAAVASRIADLLGEPLGRTAGYRVRAEARISAATRIEVVTEALLTRAIQDDPLLDGVGLVALDEFHERSIHADLALALALEVRAAREDLALLLMSATLDAERVASFLDAPVLRCPGRSHPVTTLYEPPGAGRRWEEEVVSVVARLAAGAGGAGGDILVFLPGLREIRRVHAGLEASIAADIFELHGSLSLEEQRRVLRPAGAATDGRPRRVILATSIAETSLTVPGVRAVVDAGWSRISRFHPRTGMDRLVTERVSAASADQRRGRAGREAPGRCLRVWDPHLALRPELEPEILRADLAAVVLECALWGARAPADLRWLDPPPGPAWDRARERLRELGAVAPDGSATALGRRVLALGLPPRLGVVVLHGAGRGEAPLAAALAAVLEERDPADLRGDADIRTRLERLRTGRGGSASWRQAVGREIGRVLARLGTGGRGTPGTWTAAGEAAAGGLLAAGFPDRVGRREPDGSYRFPSGRTALLPRDLRGELADSPWIVAPAVDAGEARGAIHLAAPLEEAVALQLLEPLVVEETAIEWKGLAARARLRRRAGNLPLGERPVIPAATDVEAAFRVRLEAEGWGILPWDARSESLRDRLAFLERVTGGAAPPPPAGTAAAWLAPHLDLSPRALGGAAPVITPERLTRALRARAAAVRRDFERALPESLTLPSGSKRRLDYSGEAPAVEARIQEVFGLQESPRVCGVPVTFRLLSPAQRPLQITRDLASFWRNTYPEVRREMRGRYPKHYWPEDPYQAEPIRGVRPATWAPRPATWAPRPRRG